MDNSDPVLDLMAHPRHRASDLGAALPNSAHAISVALPTWASCIGYEEKAPWVMEALQAGYPRFVTHPLLAKLRAKLAASLGLPNECVVLAPSHRAALRIAIHLQLQHGQSPAVYELDQAKLAYLVIDPAMAASVRQCSQHAGLLPSSRQCVAALEGCGDDPQAAATARQQLAELLAGWYQVSPSAIQLAANGMASIATVQRALYQRQPGAPTLQLGFPYVDLLKVQKAFGHGVHFIPGHDERAIAEAEAFIASHRLAGVFLELPSNPLLRTPDIRRLAIACRQAGLPLVIDDTVASPANVAVLDYADVVVSSLTKYVAGNGLVMGGCAVVSPSSPWSQALAAAIAAEDDDSCWWQDLTVLAQAAAAFPQRIATINRNTLELVQRLRSHPAVAEVLFPDHCPHYQDVQRPGAGFGGLCSVLLKHPAQTTPAVYDALAICKGPSLGTTFSLCCPFTLLAHYDELEWAESLGVSRWLLRFSFGCEDVDTIWGRIKPALDACCT